MRINRLFAALVVFNANLFQAHTAPGDLDPLDAAITGGNIVFATAVQQDGKFIIGGTFTSVLGVTRNNIARLNADGTLDMDFDPSATATVNCIAIQPDGKVVIGGQFFALQPNGAPSPISRGRVARLNPDGTVDDSFNPNANSWVMNVTLQPDGKVLLGGIFTTLQPNGAPTASERNYIARVNPDGTLDTGFDPNANSNVYGIALQGDGKVVLGGAFGTLQPNGAPSATARSYIARVNGDGTLDTAFDPRANSPVYCIVPQADDKLLIGGVLTTLQPNGTGSATSRRYLARVNNDGTLDSGFAPTPSSVVQSIALQADGKVVIAGGFQSLQPNGATFATVRNRIARVNANGALDTSFNPNANGNGFTVAGQADGKVLFGGVFSTLQPNGVALPTSRNLFARLQNSPATQTLSAQDTTQVIWTRSGAAPEVSNATFELSIDGGSNWTPLGAGTRIGATANWQKIGLSLPASGLLRARGSTHGGNYNGSAGRIEKVMAFNLERTTLAPNLIAPATNSLTSTPVSVGFYLPEAALSESLTLTFTGAETRVLTLAASQLTSGNHSFAFNPSNPTGSSAITVGSPIPDGLYTVTISYQNDLFNPASTATSTDVRIDATAPTIAAPTGGFTPLTIIAPTALPDFAVQAVTFDAVGVTSVTQSPAPGSPTSAGLTSVTVTASDAAGNSATSSFNVRVLSFSQDTDGDGLNDASEFQMATLGFNWQTSQVSRVNTLFASANGAGLYTRAQVQTLNVGAPLIARNAETGLFTLSIGVQKTTDLSLPFTNFPMTGPQTLINSEGKLEFTFSVPDNAAFFRLQSQP